MEMVEEVCKKYWDKVSVLFFKLMSVTELTLNWGKNQVGAMTATGWKVGGVGGSGWSGLRDFRIWSACVSLCVRLCMCVNKECQEFGAHCFRKKNKRILWEARGQERLWPWGEDGAPGSFVLLGLSLVQLLARGQRSGTLCQGALTRLDPRIEPQQVAGYVALVVLKPCPPPLCFIVILSS